MSGPFRQDSDGHLSSEARHAAWVARAEAIDARRRRRRAAVAAWSAVASSALAVVWIAAANVIPIETDWWFRGVVFFPVAALGGGLYAVKAGGRMTRKAGGAALAIVALVVALAVVFLATFRAPFVH